MGFVQYDDLQVDGNIELPELASSQEDFPICEAV